MKILFSPSEAKSHTSSFKKDLRESLVFEELFNFRLEVLEKYQHFLQNSTQEKCSKMLGIKDENEVQTYQEQDIFTAPLQTAIQRYTGVGFQHLDFKSLKHKEQECILDSTIIFSNLFGPIKAGDKIPLYKLKQGENIDDFTPYKHYKKYFSSSLDELLEEEFVVDLRAGFYEKFYTPKINTISLKFLKNGKAVSHFAKAYRGVIARYLAIYNPQNEEEFSSIKFPDLTFHEIQKSKKSKTYIYQIKK